jgi:predicted nuclease of predicted toxin-antitoxin system
MRVLLDSCIWGGARAIITAAGHEVSWVGDWVADPGDASILDRAHVTDSIFVTLDKDFGELAIVKGAPHAGIIRLVGIRAREQGPTAAHVLAAYADALACRAILTVEPDRVRIRLPDG